MLQFARKAFVPTAPQSSIARVLQYSKCSLCILHQELSVRCSLPFIKVAIHQTCTQACLKLYTLSPSLSSLCLTVHICLSRPVERDTAQQLETALAVAEGASDYLVKLTRLAADNAAAEIQAGDTLQEMMTVRHDMGAGSAADMLSQALLAAEQFPNLKVGSSSIRSSVHNMLTFCCCPMPASGGHHAKCSAALPLLAANGSCNGTSSRKSGVNSVQDH